MMDTRSVEILYFYVFLIQTQILLLPNTTQWNTLIVTPLSIKTN